VARFDRKIILLVPGTALMALLAGCGDEVGGSGQCGGVGDTGTCIKIESISPTYEVGGGEDISNVDAFMDVCSVDEQTGEQTFEVITDHGANVTFRNETMPGAANDTSRDVTITQYTLTYTLNRCPSGATCPQLSSIVSPGQSILLRANETVTVPLKFVDLATKMEYAEGVGGSLFPPHGASAVEFPSYDAVYTFEGTDIYNNPVALQGSAEFTIGDYNNCDGS
jgi:hypothetical protein